jgi:hypothetical protein
MSKTCDVYMDSLYNRIEIWENDSVAIKGDTITVLRSLFDELRKQIKEQSRKDSIFRRDIQKAVDFTNTVPYTFTNTKQYRAFIAMLGKYGYGIIKKPSVKK